MGERTVDSGARALRSDSEATCTGLVDRSELRARIPGTCLRRIRRVERAEPVGANRVEAVELRVGGNDRSDLFVAVGLVGRRAFYQPVFFIGAHSGRDSVSRWMADVAGGFVPAGFSRFDDPDSRAHLQSDHVSTTTPGIPVRYVLVAVGERASTARREFDYPAELYAGGC